MNPRLSTRLMSAGLQGVMLFAPDTGDGSGGTNNATGERGSQTGGSDQGQLPGSTGGDVTQGSQRQQFTAEQQISINAGVVRQLGPRSPTRSPLRRRSGMKDPQAMADAENQSAEEKVNARAVAAEQAAKDRIEASNTHLIAADAKVEALAVGTNPASVDALFKVADLTGVTAADDGTIDQPTIRAAVDKALVEYPEFKTTGTKTSASGTEHSEQTVIAEQFAAMGFSERVELQAENPELYAKLAA